MAKLRRIGNRKKASRESYDRVLIVTEGERTERFYFDGLKSRYRINSANVEISPSIVGSDPQSIVETAIRFRDEEISFGERYDRVYCVFDRNSHANFIAASQRAQNEGIYLARSWPCFEYWLLLHYEYMRSPFQPTHGRSSCDECIACLRKYLPNYQKADKNLFKDLEPNLEIAKNNARQARADVQRTASVNPSTEVDLLVEYLQKLTYR